MLLTRTHESRLTDQEVQRLDSWKAIAHYLGRSCRTVQRWNSVYGLPVHHMGGVTGSVFAFKNELDTWIGNRGKSITTMNASDSSVIESPSVPSSQAFSTLRAD